MTNTIRITGTEEFVKMAGNTVVSLITANYEVSDSGIKKSKNPKYKNYIRYIRVGNVKERK